MKILKYILPLMGLTSIGNAQSNCSIHLNIGSFDKHYQQCLIKTADGGILGDIELNHDNCLKFTVVPDTTIENCTKISVTDDNVKWLEITNPSADCDSILTLTDTQTDGTCLGISYVDYRGNELASPFTLHNQNYDNEIVELKGKLTLNRDNCTENHFKVRFRWKYCQ